MHITRREKKNIRKISTLHRIIASTSKSLPKNRNWTFSIVRYSTWKLEFVWNILWNSGGKKKNLRALLLSNTLSKLLSKSEVRVKFLRFPRSHSRIYDKIENSDISEIFAFSFKSCSNHIQIVRTVFHPVHIFAVFKSWVVTTVRIWSTRHISEISEFFISGIGQNRKLRNLSNFNFFMIVTCKFLCFEFLLVKKRVK